MMLAQSDMTSQLLPSLVLFAMMAAAVGVGLRPLMQFLRRRESTYSLILRSQLLMDISPRLVTVASLLGVVCLAAIGQMITGSMIGLFAGAAVGVYLPTVLLRTLARKRLTKLEEQLVGGIQTLMASVRAGLNLVQAMELLARTGPKPIREEFAHLIREYEYGVPLDEAMRNASARIGSGDFRLLFAALHTHRERGGDLGETLDRIAASIREIQRLEHRLKALTAQGRAQARFMGLMPLAMGGIYYLIDSDGMMLLINTPAGKLILGVILVLNVMGFVWIKKVVSIDV